MIRVDGTPADFDDSAMMQLVNDIYFITLTMTSVGYGDIVPSGLASRIYSILVMLLGSLAFGAIVTGCSIMVKKLVDNEAQRRIAELTQIMNRRGVSRDLQRRVRENLHQHMVRKQLSILAPHLLSSLSPAMQRELCLAILFDTLVRFPLFRNPQRSFVAELAQCHSWEQVLAGDLVADEGYAVQDLVFVIEGSLEAQLNVASDGRLELHISDATANRLGSPNAAQNPESEAQILELRVGAWFGESSLFDEGHVYTSVIIALTTVELAILPACEYARVVQKYPHLLARHNSIRRSLEHGNIRLKDLQWKDTECKPQMKKRGTIRKTLSKLLGVMDGPPKVEDCPDSTYAADNCAVTDSPAMLE